MDFEFTTLALTVGGRTRKELTTALTQYGITADANAQQLLQRMPVYPERPYAVRIGVIPASALGFTGPVALSPLLQAAQHAGLKLVPLAVAVELRLQWRKQPAGRVFVASPALGSGPRGFCLQNAAGMLTLNGFTASAAPQWSAATLFAFALAV
ncbi:hypothetical protein ACFQ3L_01515 [Lacticaseibacillus jixianensis]|uniref:Uncharacterized protein n=1 Tax=Lacticaseibacillus jixianensis TaxID=2486012 RepID=A0ABW4B5W0_9LACO|nr:hypothetical protein [Lacticaseibacillus jixianensis]